MRETLLAQVDAARAQVRSQGAQLEALDAQLMGLRTTVELYFVGPAEPAACPPHAYKPGPTMGHQQCEHCKEIVDA